MVGASIFLASDSCSFMSGESVVLSGGLFACKTEFAGTPVRLFGDAHAA